MLRRLFGPLPRLTARLAMLLAIYAVFRYAVSGLTLSHYDAKAHLVVARRIIDSLTPGWEQIGAVWLPLPHLLNMLPVQIDAFYRTGSSAIALSVLSYGLMVASVSAVVFLACSSAAGATLAAALVAANPNVLYLQATPMTESLLFGLTALQVLVLTDWVMNGEADRAPAAAGWITVLACLTRYEAWPITALAFLGTLWAWWRRGAPPAAIVRAHARLALYPLAAVAAFMLFSRITVGEWFVSGGFFVPDETLRNHPRIVTEKILEGTRSLAGPVFVRAAQIGSVAVLVLGLVRRERAALVVPLALAGAALLPLSAYLSGHPFRMRYEIPLILAGAVAAGLAVGQLRRWGTRVGLDRIVAAVLFLLIVRERPPFDPSAPMLTEAQLDRPNSRARQQVTGCLQHRYRGGTIMVSMGSLGHYMQELAWAGFDIRDFLHEGNGPIWDSAFTRGPAPLAEWVMVEEAAEGGDAVIQRQRAFPRLLEDYDVVCRGGKVALYRRKHRESF